MRLPIALVLAAFSLPGSTIQLPTEPGFDSGQVFILQDFRWVPVIVRRTPTAIDCTFKVVSGQPTVHAELVSEHDLALFSRHRDYETLARTPLGRSGRFKRLIETPGAYRVLIQNEPGAPPAAVSLVVRTDVDPVSASISTGVSPGRRLVVIVSSLTVFFGTVLWCGRKLLRAYRNRISQSFVN